jgi:hypothetical protein
MSLLAEYLVLECPYWLNIPVSEIPLLLLKKRVLEGREGGRKNETKETMEDGRKGVREGKRKGGGRFLQLPSFVSFTSFLPSFPSFSSFLPSFVPSFPSFTHFLP